MKTVIEMAREAGAAFYIDNTARVPAHWKFTPEQLKALVELVRADEREICSALDFRKEIGLTSDQDYKVSQLILFGGNT